MGSPRTVEPPDGFELDEPNAMRQGFGRLALSPGKLGDVARVIGNSMANLYGRIKDAESDPRMPSQMGDHELGQRAMLGPEVMLPAFGRAAGGVLELGAAGGRAGRAAWDSQMMNHLRALDETFAGKPHANKKIITNFRELYPDYPGSDATIQTMMYRRRAWGGVNEATGAERAAGVKDEGTELGALGGRVLVRTDAQKLLRDMKRDGHSDSEIAQAMNERFAPLLDDGENITRSMVATNRQRAQKRGDFELGAMGGRGHNSPSAITAEDVKAWAKEAGIDVAPSSGERGGRGSEYVKLRDPDNPPLNGVTQVRLGDHPGRPARADEYGRYFDAGAANYRPSDKYAPDPASSINAGGEMYGDSPQTLFDALKWRFSRAPKGESWLVGPDKAPSAQLAARDIRAQQVEPSQAAPGDVPSQMKLLAGGVPIPQGWAPEIQEGDPGRFARQGMSVPNAMLAGETRDLGGRVSSAVGAANADVDELSPDETTIPKTFPRGGLPPGFVLDAPNRNAMVPK